MVYYWIEGTCGGGAMQIKDGIKRNKEMVRQRNMI